jgi:hypothetical protein
MAVFIHEGEKMQFSRLGAIALMALSASGAALASSDDAAYVGIETALARFGSNAGNAQVVSASGNTTGILAGFSISRTVEFELAYKRASGLKARMLDGGSVWYTVRPTESLAGVVQLMRPINSDWGAGLRIGIVSSSAEPKNAWGSGTATTRSALFGLTGRYAFSKQIALVGGVDMTRNYGDTDIGLVEYRIGLRGYF